MICFCAVLKLSAALGDEPRLPDQSIDYATIVRPQLPPGWKINYERLETFVKTLPKKRRFVFEFRNSTWYDQQVYELLQRYNVAFCIYELDRHRSPAEVTRDHLARATA